MKLHPWRELLTSGVAFAVNRCEIFMEKKVTTFCGCKPSQKITLILIKILLVLTKAL